MRPGLAIKRACGPRLTAGVNGARVHRGHWVLATITAVLPLMCPPSCGAFEIDIHYDSTYVLARVAGWSSEQARIIASANQGMDENFTTHAALEFAFSTDANVASPVHQAQKNFTFHCFSKRTPPPQTLNDDVVLSQGTLLSKVKSLAGTHRLIALGVALHCVQDSSSHHDYGGTCNGLQGSCWGHAFDSIADHTSNRTNPDNPGIKWGLLEALNNTLTHLLSDTTKRDKPISISATDMGELVKALSRDRNNTDDIRQRCNRYRAAAWMRDILARSKRHIEERAIALDAQCGSMSSVALPRGRYPVLDRDATPQQVDGVDYVEVSDGPYDAKLTEVDVVQTILADGQASYSLNVRAVGLSQMAVAVALRVLLVPDERRQQAMAVWVPVDKSDDNKIKTMTVTFREFMSFAVQAELRPVGERDWRDKNIQNNRIGCAVDQRQRPIPEGHVMGGLEQRTVSRRCWNPKAIQDSSRPNPPTDVRVE